MCGCSDGEPALVYHEKVVRVRKAHRCYECSRTIALGEVALVVTAMWERGEWDRLYTCRMCRAIREAWHDVEGCWAPHGNLREEVFDCIRDEFRRTSLAEMGEDKTAYVPDAFVQAEELALFGVRLRAHLGKYGPQLGRSGRAA